MKILNEWKKLDQINFNFMYKKNFTNYSKKTYSPKRAVKNFTDLEVYQKSLEASVFAINIIFNNFEKKKKTPEKYPKNSSETTEKTLTEKSAQSSSGAADESLTRDSKTEKIFNETINANEYIIKNMAVCALSIPHLIAESHSNRFGSDDKCLAILDKVMLNCNKMVVYLEQTRDICDLELETEQFKEQIDKYFYIRRKVLNLQRVWKKYIDINKKEGKE
jgi:hypothetical protein